MMLHTISEYVEISSIPVTCSLGSLSYCLVADLESRSGAGLAGAQSIHANVYATQV